MEDLIKLDEDEWQAKENTNHIQLLHKDQWDDKYKMKSFQEGELVLWMPKATKIKVVNLDCHGRDHLNYIKC
jgi:hypothetical protein